MKENNGTTAGRGWQITVNPDLRVPLRKRAAAEDKTMAEMADTILRAELIPARISKAKKACA